MNSIKEKRKTLAAKKCEPGYKEAGKKSPSLVRSKLKLETGDKKKQGALFPWANFHCQWTGSSLNAM